METEPLGRSDRVTVLDRLTGNVASPGIVEALNPFVFKVTLGFPSDRWYDLAAEGWLWIRGHHAQDSKEVDALRVAYALGRTT